MSWLRRSTFLATIACGGLALAGHPWSDYDDTRGLWLHGQIRSTAYQRPHQVIELEQDETDHRIWTVILASPSRMESRGLKVAQLKPGLSVTVYVYPARDVPDEGRALRISIGGNVTELW